MRVIARCAVVLSAVVLAACASGPATVSFDYDENMNFAELKTYQWPAPGVTPADPNDLEFKRIERAVHKHMVARGFVMLESGEPDFYISGGRDTHYTGTRSGPRVSTSVGVGGSRGRVGISVGKTLGSGRERSNSVLLLDVQEASSQRLIWQGSAEYDEDSRLTPDERSKRIDDIVGQLLADFPPK